MTNPPMVPDNTDLIARTPAQFFFEIGYGACWAEAYIRNGETPPFPLTDGLIDRAWEITPETYDDPEEFDHYLALADRPADALEALKHPVVDDYVLPCDVHLPPATVIGAGCSLSTLKLAMELEGRPRKFAENPRKSLPVHDDVVERVSQNTPNEGLIERLRTTDWKEVSRDGYCREELVPINPDGPEAADALEALSRTHEPSVDAVERLILETFEDGGGLVEGPDWDWDRRTFSNVASVLAHKIAALSALPTASGKDQANG